jgi:hypothetical protein
LDFGFLIFYSLALGGVTLLLTRKLFVGPMNLYGYAFTLAPFIAAILDVIENINLILMLTSPSSIPEFAPMLASISATFKFGLIILTIAFWGVGLIYSLIRRE